MRLKYLICVSLLFAGLAGPAWSDDYAEKFFAKVRAEALRDLERGKPEVKIEAAGRLQPEHAPQVAAAMAPLLANPKAEIRLGAASALWTMAGNKGDIVLARSALYAALDDVDGEVAMTAAGALAAMGVPETELAPARRRMLDGPPQVPYVRFLAARGLIDIEPADRLMPHLLAWYFDTVEDEQRGGSDDNVEIAEKAIAALVSRNDAAVGPVLADALDVTQSATPFLLEQIGKLDTKPGDWVGLLLQYVDSGHLETRDTAYDLLGEQRDPESMKRWVPGAVALLADSRYRKIGLSAMYDVAGRTPMGLPELERLVDDRGAAQEDRKRALEIIVEAADTSDREATPDGLAAARAAWMRVCEPIARNEASTHERFDVCEPTSYWIIPDEAERARYFGEWLAANANVDSKLRYLDSLEGMWSKGAPAAAQIRAARTHSDPRVVQAAEAALDRIEPAWRERDARAALPPRPAVATVPAVPDGPERPKAAPQGGKPADGMRLFEAIAKGDVATVKRLVRADNVQLSVNYPGMASPTPVPIQVAINYCGIPQAAGGLKDIIAYLMGLGANPDITSMHGDRVLDQAKYSCPPEIMALLAGG